MRTIKEYYKELIVGSTNTEFEKIYNCRVVRPTYEIGEGQLGTNKSFYNSEFFLDKRYGMIDYYVGNYTFVDDIEIQGDKYYLYHNETNWFVGVKDNGVKQIAGPFSYSEKNPLRFTVGTSANGTKKESGLLITNGVIYDNNSLVQNEDGIYEDGYIILDVGLGKNIAVGDLVLFKSNVYKGATVEVDLYQNGKIYVQGINTKGSIPTAGDTIDIYSNKGEVLIVGSGEGLFSIHINGKSICDSTNILPGNIEDVVSYNGSLFVLKKDVVYYSEVTLDGNTQFYLATDRKYIRGAYKLISNGKFLLCMGEENRVFSSAINLEETTGYSVYPLNYNSDLYSRYSYSFSDSSLFFIQRDKQLMEISLSSLNATAFNIDTKNIATSVRGLLEDLDDYKSQNKGEIYANDNHFDNKINFLYQKNGSTINIEYDKEYNHWLFHTYNHKMYKITDQHLCHGYVTDIGGYQDRGINYEQSINFMVYTKGHITKLGFIRTIFGLIKGSPLILDIDIEFESSHSRTKIKKEIRDMTFDTMPADHSIDIYNFFTGGKNNVHDGNIASVQKAIQMSGRYIRFDLHGPNRFIYGYSYITAVVSNIFINERNFSS